MSKCKHLELSVLESGSWGTEHMKLDGIWYHENFPGDYNNTIRVKCLNCGKKWKYSKNVAPKWLKKHLIDLNIL